MIFCSDNQWLSLWTTNKYSFFSSEISRSNAVFNKEPDKNIFQEKSCSALISIKDEYCETPLKISVIDSCPVWGEEISGISTSSDIPSPPKSESSSSSESSEFQESSQFSGFSESSEPFEDSKS